MKLCGFDVGLDHPFFLIAGPCVIESLELQMETAGRLKEITGKLGIPFIFVILLAVHFWRVRRDGGISGPGKGGKLAL